jgi:hypothetical protein
LQALERQEVGKQPIADESATSLVAGFVSLFFPISS